jgi:CBS domain-containing protein
MINSYNNKDICPHPLLMNQLPISRLNSTTETNFSAKKRNKRKNTSGENCQMYVMLLCCCSCLGDCFLNYSMSFLFYRTLQVPIQEVLDAKHAFRWVDPVIRRDATVKEAIQTCIEGGLSGMMVVEMADDGVHKRVVGLLTSRDLLRIMAASIREDENVTSKDILDRVVGDYMTPISQVIYGRPNETVGMCRTLMAKLGIKCLPILDKEGRVEGLITARDMNDFGLSASDKGGKKSYLNDISERVGLSSDTSMAEPPTYMHAHLALEQSPLFVNLGIYELPHPWKSDESVGFSQRGELPGGSWTVSLEASSTF